MSFPEHISCMSWTKNTEAHRSDFFNKFFCCSIAQFIYIGFRCRKPNLKSMILFKVVWRFYHKGCLIIHYNIRRHSGQTVVDSQVNNLFFTSASTSNKTILSVRGHCVTRWRDNSKLANQASTLLPFVVKKKKIWNNKKNVYLILHKTLCYDNVPSPTH